MEFLGKDPIYGYPAGRIFGKVREPQKTKQVVFITGVRRSGKSTLIKQYIKKMIDEGEDKKNFLYIYFEETRFIDDLSIEFMDEVYQAYLEIVQPSSTPYLFLDEVQHVKGWERFVRALHEKGQANFFVSGSSTRLLSKEFGTALMGRHVDIHVNPLNFREFLDFKGLMINTRLELLSNKTIIRQMLREYLESGGFPAVVLSGEKKEQLSRYFEDIIYRDIADRHSIKKIDKLKSLGKYYLTNISSPTSFRKIANVIGISLDSIERYSYFFHDAYLIFFINKFSYSLKEQEINPRKVYAIDTGLRNIVSFRFSEDIGKLYENMVFLELNRKDKDIYYYKDKYECDFIVKTGEKIREAFQVCYSLTYENRESELNGLMDAMIEFDLEEGTIITDDLEANEEHNGKSIRFLPLWKWLFEGQFSV